MVRVEVPEPVTERNERPGCAGGQAGHGEGHVPLKPLRAATVIVLVMLLPVSTAS